MSSRYRDPRDPYNPFLPDARIPPTSDSDLAASAQRRLAPNRPAQPAPPENANNRSTTARLPAISPAGSGQSKQPTKLRLPAIDPARPLHTRPALLRSPGGGRMWPDNAPEEEAPEEHKPAQASLWGIAGLNRSGAGASKQQQTAYPFKMKVQIALLALALFVLLGAQTFIAHMTFNCMGALARASQQGCPALSVFPARSGAAEDNTAEDQTQDSPTEQGTAGTAALPTVPDDLPTKVHDFVALALPYAVQAHQELGWHTSVLLAQWGLEHGWHVPDAQGYNWGNTTYAPGCPYREGSRFCYSATPEEGLRVFLYGAHLHYYDGVGEAAPQGADAVAVALGKSPWSAGHYGGADNPGSSLLSLMRSYNLYRLDMGE